ncbi:tRNA epoxyqueuosine(34) reductase QueG [Granulicella paludicola]|uniref:tRNA epoxyqueuosine(34) reductase QueG n=1 Tax=Granulicella paludicola TaxID=474951 RepID=UPI0021E026F0|nr:tRNA epoxyqueuosine(34) reductase QueG [Granulicella paludicola]
MTLTSTDRNWIEQQSLGVGFDLAGIAAVPTEASEEHAATNERFSAWISAGHAGEMEYLKREDDAGQLVRGDLRRAIPWARSVITCAVNYSSKTPLSIAPAAKDTGWVARYAWSGREPNANGNAGSDYHDVLLKQLRTLEARLKQRFECDTNCYVDTGPILERGYATRAGIGWIGKNTCVINQQQGSWLLLGVIVTSLELETASASLPAADRCGSCTRCIDACPTDALIPPGLDGHRQMDATRCIAYLTIEKKGSIPEELREPMGRQVFGCDICQDVCPWNRRAPIKTSSALPPRQDLINPSLEWLASLEGPEFTRVFRGSPVERTRRQTSRRKFFRRNVAIAMGNSGEAKFLPKLDGWAAGEDPTLAEAAAWAAARLRAADK